MTGAALQGELHGAIDEATLVSLDGNRRRV
jgi:hypothetical protein